MGSGPTAQGRLAHEKRQSCPDPWSMAGPCQGRAACRVPRASLAPGLARPIEHMVYLGMFQALSGIARDLKTKEH